MTLRNDVNVAGVPGTWTTNLCDDDVRAFYENYGSEVGEELRIQVMTLEIKFRWTDKTVPFKEGACLWNRIQEKNWLLYRTHFEWEIWAARKQELDELKEEQEQERAALTQLLRTEDRHLTQAAREALEAKDYERAERHLIARAELAKEVARSNLQNWWSYEIIESVARWFTEFPSADNGIAFLRKYDCRASSFLEYVSYSLWGPFRTRDVAEEAKVEKVCDAAASLFPSDGHLFKEICLVWRRHGRIDLAIKYCKIAVQNAIRDDTKSGFVGRLKRLEREKRKSDGGILPPSQGDS